MSRSFSGSWRPFMFQVRISSDMTFSCGVKLVIGGDVIRLIFYWIGVCPPPPPNGTRGFLEGENCRFAVEAVHSGRWE